MSAVLLVTDLLAQKVITVLISRQHWNRKYKDFTKYSPIHDAAKSKGRCCPLLPDSFMGIPLAPRNASPVFARLNVLQEFD